MIKITGEEIIWIMRMYELFRSNIDDLIGDLDANYSPDEEYVFENPKWGLEAEIEGKKYQLIMELKEVK